ncbi:MAG TPA: ABC transporter substrate-binding protein [Flavobacteriales bacterium]|nr:ABC transporter substrate-binding protein [Flavobacteriales bacterium]
MLRIPFIALGVALVMGCGKPAPRTHGGGDIHGGVFNINETQVLRSIFPLQIALVSEQHVGGQIYEGLVRFNARDLSVEPALAERWEIDPSNKIYTFHLRHDVRFHDDTAFPDGIGRGLTAKDVVHCFTSICEKGLGDAVFWMFQDKVEGADEYHASGRKGGEVKGIKALDDHTVQITLVRPQPNFLQIIAGSGCWIWPRELLQAHDQELLHHAIGTGPFRLKVVRPEEAIVLERNADYWGQDGQGRPLPYLDAVRITLTTDKDKEVAEFLRGHLTMVSEVSLPSFGLLADSLDPATGERRFLVRSTPALAVQYYGFNANKPPFNDARVRRAFAMALDKHRLVDSVLHGLAVPAEHGLVAPGLTGYPYGLVPGLPYDPDSARILLALAGYPQGRGFPRVQLHVNTSGFGYSSVAAAAQEMLWRELGVAITVTTIAPKTYYDRIERGHALFWREGWVADLPDPENFLALLYGKNAEADTALPSPLNTTRYANPRFDALFLSASSKGNEVERMKDLALAEAVAMHDVPLVPLYHERYVMLVAPHVHGLHINAMELLDLREVHLGRQAPVPAAADTTS